MTNNLLLAIAYYFSAMSANLTFVAKPSVCSS